MINFGLWIRSRWMGQSSKEFKVALIVINLIWVMWFLYELFTGRLDYIFK